MLFRNKINSMLDHIELGALLILNRILGQAAMTHPAHSLGILPEMRLLCSCKICRLIFAQLAGKVPASRHFADSTPATN